MNHCNLGLPKWLSGKESTCNAGDTGDVSLIPGKIPWRRAWQPTPVFFLGESHRQRSLVGYSPFSSVQFSRSVTSNSATPWTAARQASLSITNSRSLLKLTSIESVMGQSMGSQKESDVT